MKRIKFLLSCRFGVPSQRFKFTTKNISNVSDASKQTGNPFGDHTVNITKESRVGQKSDTQNNQRTEPKL
jgi:hypothetical protein